MREGGCFLARNAAGESFATLGAAWIVRSARPSAVRNRWPYPSGRPASSVKIEDGKSTAVPVCGMVYLVHLTGCADTVDVEATSANARTTIDFIAFPSGNSPWE